MDTRTHYLLLSISVFSNFCLKNDRDLDFGLTIPNNKIV